MRPFGNLIEMIDESRGHIFSIQTPFIVRLHLLWFGKGVIYCGLEKGTLKRIYRF